jgi:hypothetical protein
MIKNTATSARMAINAGIRENRLCGAKIRDRHLKTFLRILFIFCKNNAKRIMTLTSRNRMKN